jgi:hypothetical protein
VTASEGQKKRKQHDALLGAGKKSPAFLMTEIGTEECGVFIRLLQGNENSSRKLVFRQTRLGKNLANFSENICG